MARNISDFIANFDGGAKPNLFRVSVYPGGVPTVNASLMNSQNGPSLVFMAKGTTLPESSVGEITVPYLGRQIKVPGDRTYADWTVTIMNTEGFELRKEMERWNAAINGHESNVSLGNAYAWTSASGAICEQLRRDGSVTHSYQLNGIFPREVSSIDLAYDQNDVISEFTVTFAYTYHVPLI